MAYSQFAGLITMTTIPASVSSILSAAGMTGGGGLAYLRIAEAGAGNLVISTDSAIDAEANGYPIGDDTNPLELTTGGSSSDVISADQLYLFSATASKTAFIIARTKV